MLSRGMLNKWHMLKQHLLGGMQIWLWVEATLKEATIQEANVKEATIRAE